ncbi:MAG: WecB/TagA/CpsF family glycosyltransferase [Lachnospiraceae bacterium]|nr:WecB/TagA/CpsF family glycosyltransferase [Lachnospiraceae bacterium]
MNKKLKVLDVRIDDLSAKDAMRQAIQYLETDLISTVEIVTAKALVQTEDNPMLKEAVENFDLALAGDRTILEVAGIMEQKNIREVDKQTFLKMFLHYLHKSHRRVFVLAETEEELNDFITFLNMNYSNIIVSGSCIVLAHVEKDDGIVNIINGLEVDCVVSILETPIQELFIVNNKTLLNVRMWLGIGKVLKPYQGYKNLKNPLKNFINKQLLKYQLEKYERNNKN